MDRMNWRILLLLIIVHTLGSCQNDSPDPGSGGGNFEEFYFGADLSYVNQVQDHGGSYSQLGVNKSPYKIFKDNGTKIVRLRLWHNPTWTKEVYGANGTQLYNDIKDVEKSIDLAKQNGLQVLLDFHYSDVWADPGTQKIPDAWKNIKSIEVLSDSVYNYTSKTLNYLNSKSLLPEFVQIGNETNCGMFFTDAAAGFPTCNGCNGQWTNLRAVLKSGLRAVRDVSIHSAFEIKSILHVADPKNVDWWFTNVTNGGEIQDFDIIGFSYYPIWHTTVPVSQLSENVSAFKTKFNKDVMILETAYPWTTTGNDSYNNIFGSQTPVSGFPFSNQGQLDMMKAITQELIEVEEQEYFIGNRHGISSNMKDLWGTGSSWENNTFFDYNGELNVGIQFIHTPIRIDTILTTRYYHEIKINFCQAQLLVMFSIFCHSNIRTIEKNDGPVYVDKNGTLRWTKDNKEAAFFGVNYTHRLPMPIVRTRHLA